VSATRREALGAAAVASAGALVFGARTAMAAGTGDEQTLLGAVQLEQAAVATYKAGIASGALNAATTKTFTTFAAQEQAHLDAVSKLLQSLGGVVPQPPAADQVKVGGRSPADLRSQADWVGFANDLEHQTIAGYYAAQGTLKRAEYLQVTASIMANEGQHLAILREAMNRPPVPNAFETGKA
jgi:rubrerythrin